MWPLPTSNKEFANCQFLKKNLAKHMFCCNLNICIPSHDNEEAATIYLLDPFIITNLFLQKSPPNTIVRPPKGLSLLRISRNV